MIWYIEYLGGRSFKVYNNKTFSDSAIVYNDGWIVYDFPERVPAYVKVRVRNFAKQVLGKEFAR